MSDEAPVLTMAFIQSTIDTLIDLGTPEVEVEPEMFLCNEMYGCYVADPAVQHNATIIKSESDYTYVKPKLTTRVICTFEDATVESMELIKHEIIDMGGEIEDVQQAVSE